MMFRRAICGALFAPAVLGIVMLDPMMSTGQPGGGFGGKGGGGDRGPGGGFGKGGGGFTDPERVFGFYAKGADVIDFSRMDPNMKAFAKSGFEKMGMPVPTDTTVITKAQFVESFSRALAAKGMTPTTGGGGPGFGGGPGRGLGAPGDGKPVAVTFGGGQPLSPAGMPPGFGGDRGKGFGGPGFGGPGGDRGFNPGGDRGSNNFRMTDQDIERKFAESDLNRDGKLSEDEISDRSPLKASFKDADANRDGYIDLAEYKAYIAARFGGESDGGSYGSYAGNGNYGKDLRNEKKEELPVAIRYGKLPVGLPNWWDSLDTDKDGQIGLYEWRADGRDVKEFQKMDLDGDGILAPQEWQRYNVLFTAQAKAIAAEEEIGGTSSSPAMGTRPGSGMGKDKGGFGPKAPDTGNKGDGKNPFREGGKK